VFSAVRRIQTEFRSSMDISLLESLIMVKTHMLGRNENCYTRKFTDEFLCKAKKATSSGLKAAEAQGVPENSIPEDVSGNVLKMLSE